MSVASRSSMGRRGRVSAACSFAAAVGLACSLPSDVSEQFEVQLPEVDVVLTVGDTIRLFPTVLRDGQPIEGLDVRVSSDNPAVALVDDEGLVRGVGVGFAEVRAFLPSLQNSVPAVRTVRVLRAVTIDTVIARSTDSPDGRLVSWGEEIEIQGVGLDPTLGNVVFVGDRPARLKEFRGAAVDDTLGLDTLVVWIPVGAPEDSDVLVSRLGGSTASWPVEVRQQDVLERASRLRIEATENIEIPEMAIEVSPEMTGRPCFARYGFAPDDCFSDGYQLVAPPSGEMTVIVELDEPVSKFSGLLELRSDSIGTVDDTAWLLTPFMSFCTDYRFITNLFPQIRYELASQSRSYHVALKLAPGQRIQLNITLHGEYVDLTPNVPAPPSTTRYGLTVREGYHSILPPDAFEENNHCFAGQVLDVDANDLELTFDTGNDLDWFEFTVPGPPPPTPTAGVESEPNGSLALADTVALNSETTGNANSAGDTDFYAFFADAGTLLDLEVVTEQETGSVTLNSFIQLYFGGQPIAFNDNYSERSSDSRIIVSAPETGWYTLSVQDLESRNDLIQDYALRVSTPGPLARRYTLDVTSPDGLEEGSFDPEVSLFSDDRQTPLAAPRLLRRGGASLSELLLPGDYMLLISNPPGTPARYRLQTSSVPIG
jgi:hypothetical protein